MLLSRWKTLMHDLGLPANQETFTSLIEAYSEKHRHYHDVSHLKAVLAYLDQAESLTAHKDYVELALWFHDAIYQPFSGSNEKDSADWACRFLADNEINKQVQTVIRQLIMATAHSNEPLNDDERLIIDIDLSVLGQDETAYQAFLANVRKEYGRVPDLIYTSKRKALLQKFLDRDRIYYFDQFYEELESQARINLLWEIVRLDQA